MCERTAFGEVAGSSKSRLLHRILTIFRSNPKVRRGLFATCFFFFSRRTRGWYSPNVNVVSAQRGTVLTIRSKMTLAAKEKERGNNIAQLVPCSVNAYASTSSRVIKCCPRSVVWHLAAISRDQKGLRAFELGIIPICTFFL